jgi:hypothetical protein
VDYCLKFVISMVGFIELGNRVGRDFTLSRRPHLRGNTRNMHRTSHNYSLAGKRFITAHQFIRLEL